MNNCHFIPSDLPLNEKKVLKRVLCFEKSITHFQGFLYFLCDVVLLMSRA